MLHGEQDNEVYFLHWQILVQVGRLNKRDRGGRGRAGYFNVCAETTVLIGTNMTTVAKRLYLMGW